MTGWRVCSEKNADHADSDQSLSLPLVANGCRSRFVVAQSYLQIPNQINAKAAAGVARELASESDALLQP